MGVYDGHEELVEQLGAKGVAEIVIGAATLFEKSKLNFKDSERPIPMTVSEWKQHGDDSDEETGDDAEGEDAEQEEGEEDNGEEEGEEEEGEEDDEEEPATKKQKTS